MAPLLRHLVVPAEAGTSQPVPSMDISRPRACWIGTNWYTSCSD